MRQSPSFGILLALIGTLVLTPDALLMRLSGMDGYQMVGWRGGLMGLIFLLSWGMLSKGRWADTMRMMTPFGVLIVICQYFNASLFALGVSWAPAAIVLIGVATVPVFAAVFSWLMIGEKAGGLTWITIVLVMAGVFIAVLGGERADLNFDAKLVPGALAGLGVGAALAMNFVVLRSNPDLPILLCIGTGALLAGISGILVTGPEMMTNGTVWAIAIAGGVVLPFSFFSLSLSSRYTAAANVSLIMLLETVIGPLWVWWGVGEELNASMLIGGTIVVISLAVYIVLSSRNAARKACEK
ncbi:DMT family transporter [Roseovarius sp. EL26]|uniref:DMT family transporter n=1 Tax=Roseovarius sp. EL26 TaxID=2126672 RepID=UPI000EA32247|nr:DMT family transporter [Roseovarius sp. EL26]